MNEPDTHLAYWDGIGATKTFTHPLAPDWLAELDRGARVLDYGCGYGRLMGELGSLGFTDVSGADLSPALVERGRGLLPGLRFDVLEAPPRLARPDAGLDLVLLFAVLTCVPDAGDQRAMIAELHRVLAPGGLLYVSDVLLQQDARNRTRYAAHAERSGAPYGVFATGDGALVRHHEIGHLRELLGEFELVRERRLDVATMNGNTVEAVQLLLCKGD
ncbi:class I SAM-dependent methyltransferase [Kitasatospora viridis]|uniref:Methyltransferase family protein n=1 Tax=Kitasatospora viridis TaxID=281105 RepID=A0A561TT37_9ACTN|nr:class I SAM-dependent methyltransferase [Kitasatospora viridis]TWF90283.1 methyltransferase family protein [Kitasatospora viridis]